MSDASGTPVMPARRGWLAEVEAVRAFAYVSIVFGHAIGILNDVPHSAGVMSTYAALLAVTRPALPAFMALSALLIAYRFADGRRIRIPLPGLVRLCAAYVVWTAAYVVILKPLGGSEPMLLQDLLREIGVNIVTGRGWYHLWYFLIAIQIYLVAPWLAAIMRTRSFRDQVVAVGVLVAANVILLGQIGQPSAIGILGGKFLFLNAFDRVVIFWVGYVGIGVLFGLNWERLSGWLDRRRIPVIVAYALSVAFVAAISAKASMVTSGDFGASADISRVMQAWILPFEAFSVVAWLAIARVVSRMRVSKALSVLGAASFGGYLIHPLVLHGLRQNVFAYYGDANPALLVIVLFVVTLVASTALSLALARVGMSVGTILVGARPRARSDATDAT